MRKKVKLKKYLPPALILLCCLLTIFFPKILGRRSYYISAALFAVFALTALFTSFENSEAGSLKLSVTAVMCAAAVGGRIVFAGIPFVKPVAALVIICGTALGALPGFVCGSCAMLASNFMFGQGPWTLWQMLAFGLLGYFAGLIFCTGKKTNKTAVSLYGFAGYVFFAGPILDLSGLFIYTSPSAPSLAATLAAGFPVNLIGGCATFVFLYVLFVPITAKLDRLKIKYGL